METVTLNQIPRLSQLLKNADIFMGLAVMCILVVMIIPVPPILLDFLLSFNITFSFCLPEFDIGCRSYFAITAFVHMPETAMNKYNLLVFNKN